MPLSFPRFQETLLFDVLYFFLRSACHTSANPLTIALRDNGVVFDWAFTLRANVSHMRFPGKNKLDGWRYSTAVTWKNTCMLVIRSVKKIPRSHALQLAVSTCPTVHVVEGKSVHRSNFSCFRHVTPRLFPNRKVLLS